MRVCARHFQQGLIALAGLIIVASAGTSARAFPEFIQLPADFGPEGIAVGNGSTFYAGSLAATTRGQILVETCEPANSPPWRLPTACQQPG
jgi:hypothetical protein